RSWRWRRGSPTGSGTRGTAVRPSEGSRAGGRPRAARAGPATPGSPCTLGAPVAGVVESDPERGARGRCVPLLAGRLLPVRSLLVRVGDGHRVNLLAGVD